MKSARVIVLFALLIACSPATLRNFVPNEMSDVAISKELDLAHDKVINCHYFEALDTFQQYTVIGSRPERIFAYRWLGVLYLEMMNFDEFNHTVDRFLFSRAGRGQDREKVVLNWRIEARKCALRGT
ncbi:hypothetical protein CS022_05505 [Veronia nyctiphanis]|uniref:Uncharacterized protein n=1 Tax=Veronia nyctiphanis TaxID=1278244 RepID=A0A4Q0YYF1_9GAMM|nr:hypothetical protein [Veronia nyctiphanis]RXJ74091.1 hypothetical protein CS022_05505 [Veronia nyctiphanis]